MKLNFVDSKQSNISSDVNLTIGDPRVIISILTEKLYSQPVKTSIKEYLSNAIDAHREIGQKRRVEITTPNRLNNSQLSLRDFGAGLSPQSMKDVFMCLGVSTKRDSDLLIGGYGIGSKSFASFSSACKIESWHKGIHYTYLCSLIDGMISLKLLNKEASDEPSGLKITLTIPDTSYFDLDSIIRYIRPEEMPLIDGALPEFNIKWETFIYRGREYEYTIDQKFYNKVVVDNFAYPLPNGSHRIFGHGVVVRLPMDMVRVNPNRETIAPVPELREMGNHIVKFLNKEYCTSLKKFLTKHGPFAQVPMDIYYKKLPSFSDDISFTFKHNGYHYTYDDKKGCITCDNAKLVYVNKYSLISSRYYKPLLGRNYLFKPVGVYHVPYAMTPSKTFISRAPVEHIILVEADSDYIVKYNIPALSIYKKKPTKGKTTKDDTLNSIRVINIHRPYKARANLVDIKTLLTKQNRPVYWIPYVERGQIFEKYGISQGSLDIYVALLTRKQEKKYGKMLQPLAAHMKALKHISKYNTYSKTKVSLFNLVTDYRAYTVSGYGVDVFLIKLFIKLYEKKYGTSLFSIHNQLDVADMYVLPLRLYNQNQALRREVMRFLDGFYPKHLKDHLPIAYCAVQASQYNSQSENDFTMEAMINEYGKQLYKHFEPILKKFHVYNERFLRATNRKGVQT